MELDIKLIKNIVTKIENKKDKINLLESFISKPPRNSFVNIL